MNILFLEQYSKISGGQLCLLELIERLDRQEFNPVVAVPEKGELTERLHSIGVENLEVPVGGYSSGKKSLWDMLNYFLRSIILVPLILRIVKAHNIDLVYANAPRTFPWGTAAARLAGVPVVWHVHSMLGRRLEKRLTRSLLRLKPARIITVSRAVAASFLDRESDPEADIVYNGADLARFNPERDGTEFRKEFPVAPDMPLIGIIGQVSEWKGHETFIRAAGEVVKKFPEARFMIIGAPLYDGVKGERFIDYLKSLIGELGLENNVIFTGPRQDIPQIMNALNIIVLASKEPDPCPRVVMEGLASGRPVIATAHGGAPEIINPGVDGLLFAPGDYQELANKIVQLIEQPDLAESIGKKAREKAENRFNIENYSGQLIKILREAASPGVRGGKHQL